MRRDKRGTRTLYGVGDASDPTREIYTSEHAHVRQVESRATYVPFPLLIHTLADGHGSVPVAGGLGDITVVCAHRVERPSPRLLRPVQEPDWLCRVLFWS